MERRGVPEPVAAVARDLLDMLATSSPDTGDDVTQLALDDALDAIEDHLRALLAGPPTLEGPTTGGAR